MLTYVIRRLLLMIPTLFGITLLVFMMLALSPGGIGAALLASGGGGSMQASNDLSIRRAKLEDRYGLNEPVLVQYGRWLERISPIKFGQRDLRSPAGDLISKPRPIPAPAAWMWFAPSLPVVPPLGEEVASTQFPAGDAEARAEAFKKVERAYAEARAAFTSSDAQLRDAIKRHLEATLPRERWGRYISGPGIRAARLSELKPDESHASFAEVRRLGERSLMDWRAAVQARQLLIAGMRTTPYPEVGWGLSGVVSLSWPDLGIAFSTQRPVLELIKSHLPVTLMLNLIAFPIIYLVAVPSGMLAAVRRGSVADVGLGTLYIALYSIPVVLAGVLTLGFLATPEYLNWFPTAGLHDKDSEGYTFLFSSGPEGFERGYLLDLLHHVVLPVLCLVYGGFAVISKQTRAAMLENLNADYVRTAKAKGVSGRDVLYVHVLRNSLLPLITLFVTIFPAMLAGSVVVERIFSVPGMGALLIDAIGQRDRELILANTTIIAMVNLLALLFADILYAMADPRIAYK